MSSRTKSLPHYANFYGTVIEIMPRLVAEGRVLMPTFSLMRRKLETSTLTNITQLAKQTCLSDCVVTADAPVYHPDGTMKIALETEYLRQLNKKSRLVNGVLVLEDGAYEGIDDRLKLTAEEIRDYTGRHLSRKDALDNRIWRILARHPDEVPREYAYAEGAELLEEYVGAVYKYGISDDLRMGINVTSPKHPMPTMRFWNIHGFGNKSVARGWEKLDEGIYHAIGVIPRAKLKHKVRIA